MRSRLMTALYLLGRKRANAKARRDLDALADEFEAINEAIRAELRAKGRITVIAGADDQLMDADGYRRALPSLGVAVTVLPSVDT
jgi:hypothetical protein